MDGDVICQYLPNAMYPTKLTHLPLEYRALMDAIEADDISPSGQGGYILTNDDVFINIRSVHSLPLDHIWYGKIPSPARSDATGWLWPRPDAGAACDRVITRFREGEFGEDYAAIIASESGLGNGTLCTAGKNAGCVLSSTLIGNGEAHNRRLHTRTLGAQDWYYIPTKVAKEFVRLMRVCKCSDNIRTRTIIFVFLFVAFQQR